MRINDPLTKDALKAGDLIPPGIYPFEVLDASECYSKAGDEQIKLKIRIFFMNSSSSRIMFDYLTEKMKFKLGHFFEAVGLYDEYNSGTINAMDCIGKSGELKIIINKGKDGYPDQSSVIDYILSDAQQAAKQERKVAAAKSAGVVDNAPPFDDEIPF